MDIGFNKYLEGGSNKRQFPLRNGGNKSVNVFDGLNKKVSRTFDTVNAHLAGKYSFILPIYSTTTELQKICFPYHFAVQESDTNLFHLLYKEGADINQLDEYGNNSLHVACLGAKYDLIADLIEKGCNLNKRNQFGESPLEMIAEKYLLEDKVLISHLKELHNIGSVAELLHHTNSIAIADFLISSKISVNCLNNRRETPLISALRAKNRPEKISVAFIENLLSKGASLQIGLPYHVLAKVNEDGLFKKEHELFEIFKKYDGDINQVDTNGDNTLMHICEMLSVYVNRDCRDMTGKLIFEKITPVREYVWKLIYHLGANYAQRNHFHRCPLDEIIQYQLLSDICILGLQDDYIQDDYTCMKNIDFV